MPISPNPSPPPPLQGSGVLKPRYLWALDWLSIAGAWPPRWQLFPSNRRRCGNPCASLASAGTHTHVSIFGSRRLFSGTSKILKFRLFLKPFCCPLVGFGWSFGDLRLPICTRILANPQDIARQSLRRMHNLLPLPMHPEQVMHRTTPNQPLQPPCLEPHPGRHASRALSCTPAHHSSCTPLHPCTPALCRFHKLRKYTEEELKAAQNQHQDRVLSTQLRENECLNKVLLRTCKGSGMAALFAVTGAHVVRQGLQLYAAKCLEGVRGACRHVCRCGG